MNPAESPAAAWRIGSVQYLNAAPLTWGLGADLVLTTPARLAERLQKAELDAGLVSIVEVLYHDHYDVLDGIAIASDGPVKSVFLAHRKPLAELTEIYCDPASLTSVRLLQVLLAEYGLRPALRPLASYAAAAGAEAVLLIGNAALDFLPAPAEYAVWDLGAAWKALTGLPFVYAIWALRRDRDHAALRARLREARDQGLAHLEELIQGRPEYNAALRREYLTHCIRYGLGDAEKQGIARFIGLLRRHGFGPVVEPRWVG